MRANCLIAASRWVYARLLNMYPKEHRLEYGGDMLQVFTDQCRSAWQAKKGGGIVSLWMRTLLDLVASVLSEHLTSPGASRGLLEAVPDAPLPWKGVALVLIPGLVFFVAQIGQITGVDWFFTVIQWAAYFLILPVLLVWGRTRRFPVWGLIPLGMLFRTLMDYGSQLQNGIVISEDLLSLRLAAFFGEYASVMRVIFIASLGVLLIWLAGSMMRRGELTKGVWICLVLFLLISLSQFLLDFLYQSRYYSWQAFGYLQTESARNLIWDILDRHLYYSGGFLALILLGGLLVRRHGVLTLLLPLGYLIPTVLYGRSTNYYGSISVEQSFLFWVSMAVVAYRLLVTLAAPCWIVRSPSESGQKRAAWITSLLAIGIWAALSIAVLLSVTPVSNLHPVEIPYIVSDPLLVAAGMGLALTLYRKPNAAQSAPVQSASVAEAVG